MKPKLLRTDNIYEGGVFNVKKVLIDDGDLEYYREIIEHGGSAVVLPVHSNGDVTLVRQFRYPADDFLYEIPAGTVEEGETPEECAAREIEEETGLRAEKLEKISEFYVSPGFLTEKMHLFAATGLTETSVNPDFDEKIEIVRMSMDDALSLVRDGGIVDAKTIIGILLTSGTQNLPR